MGVALNLFAKIRQAAADTLSGGDGKLERNPRGDLLVAQALSPRSELVRLGDSYAVAIATGSAFAPVAAWPTTRAELILWNGEDPGGKSYVIDSAWVASITSVAAASSITLLGQVVPSKGVAAPTDDTAQIISSLSGRSSNYGGRARRAVANTAFCIANGWQALGAVAASPSASIGAGAFAECEGRFIIPPGGTFGLNAVFSTAAGTAIAGLSWHEIQLS